MKYNIPADLKDRFFYAWNGDYPPDDISLDYLNNHLERFGLYGVSRFIGLSVDIKSLSDYPLSCISGECNNPRCRSIHDASDWDIERMHIEYFQPFYDELRDIRRRRETMLMRKAGADDSSLNSMFMIRNNEPSFLYKRPYGKMYDPMEAIAASGAVYIRERLREVSFMRKVLPPTFA